MAPAIEAVDLVLPDRSLEPEVLEVLQHGRLRGADLWHLACALYVAGDARKAGSTSPRIASVSPTQGKWPAPATSTKRAPGIAAAR